MPDLIHILGSPITHHNTTVLNFFQAHHSSLSANMLPIRFMMSVNLIEEGQKDTLKQIYPNLDIDLYEGKKQLAIALIEHAKAHSACRYFLHGQFNPSIWFNLLFKRLDGQRFAWHIWGADLYEEEQSLKYRLFYKIRRLAQAQINWIFATNGDAAVLGARLKSNRLHRLYFPTKMNYDLTPSDEDKATRLMRLENRPIDSHMTILLGNSGDKTNHHLLGLDTIYQTFGDRVNILIPMGYPDHNDAYIAQVRHKAEGLFKPGTVQILTQKLPFDEYLNCLAQCDLAYFLFERQQGIGTISLCIQLGVPFVLHPKNAFSVDLSTEMIPYFTIQDSINLTTLVALQTKLNQVKIEEVCFFAPNFMPDWYQALALITGVKHVTT